MSSNHQLDQPALNDVHHRYTIYTDNIVTWLANTANQYENAKQNRLEAAPLERSKQNTSELEAWKAQVEFASNMPVSS
jgi:hypothetical protein